MLTLSAHRNLIFIVIFIQEANFTRKCFTEGSWILEKMIIEIEIITIEYTKLSRI